MDHFDWGLPVAIELNVAGIGAITFLIAVIIDLTGSKKLTSFRLTGAIIAPCLAILSVILLVLDLSRPKRFWEMILERGESNGIASAPYMFNSGPTTSWGTWILILFIIISLIYMIISLITKIISRGEIARKVVGVVGLLFCILLILYIAMLTSALL